MTTEPVLPQWLIAAGNEMSDAWIPVQSMPGVPGPVRISMLGLVGAAYLAGYDTAREQFAAGVPDGARIVTAEQWAMLQSVLSEATGWRTTPDPPTKDRPTVSLTKDAS